MSRLHLTAQLEAERAEKTKFRNLLRDARRVLQPIATMAAAEARTKIDATLAQPADGEGQ